MKTLLMLILSTGWLLPLYLGISSYLSWAQAEVWPRLLGQNPMNSFPFIKFSQQMLAVSIGWLALTIAVWTILLFRRL